MDVHQLYLSFLNFSNSPMYLKSCPSKGGGYTGLHQDGHGTVDSGHTNIQGYNEVIMLRRLTEDEKIKACSILQHTDYSLIPHNGDDSLITHNGERILYTQPHDLNELQKSGMQWPTKAIIKQWDEWG